MAAPEEDPDTYEEDLADGTDEAETLGDRLRLGLDGIFNVQTIQDTVLDATGGKFNLFKILSCSNPLVRQGLSSIIAAAGLASTADDLSGNVLFRKFARTLVKEMRKAKRRKIRKELLKASTLPPVPSALTQRKSSDPALEAFRSHLRG